MLASLSLGDRPTSGPENLFGVSGAFYVIFSFQHIPKAFAFAEAIVAHKICLALPEGCIWCKYHIISRQFVPARLRPLVIFHIRIGRHAVNGYKALPKRSCRIVPYSCQETGIYSAYSQFFTIFKRQGQSWPCRTVTATKNKYQHNCCFFHFSGC